MICLLIWTPVHLQKPNVESITNQPTDTIEDSSPTAKVDGPIEYDCSSLIKGQFLCTNLDIDEDTQQPRNCNRDTQKSTQWCEAAPGITCLDTHNSSFTKEIPCKWTNGYRFDTALMLSIFLGMFGADRFYLGHPAIGLLKFSTLGFFFLGHLLDIVLIASQVVGPADGSHYVISYFGAGLSIITGNEDTAKKVQSDWF